MTPRTKPPSFENLLTVSRWARVVVLARAMRRLQPLLAEVWPEAPKWCAEAIEKAIASGETAAAQGAPTADMRAAAFGAMKVYGCMPDKLLFSDRGFARDIGYTASRVSFAGSETEPFFAMEGIQGAIAIAEEYAEYRKDTALAKPFVQVTLREYEQLKAASQAGKWKTKTPVDGAQLGEIWPDGLPQGWPPPLDTKPKRKEVKPIDLKSLRLPRELVSFLKTGSKLKYRAAKTEVGPIQLKPLDHLQLSTFEVEQPATKGKGGKSTTARVRGVDLVAECDNYGPDGILIWLPDYRCFGQHDPDHLRLVVFPRAKWSDLVAAPAKYLDAQWNDFATFGEYLEVKRRPPANGVG